jgi:hypothetical protein
LQRFNLQRQAEDFRAGQICTVVASCMAPSKGRPHRPSDFFSSLPRAEEKPQSPQEMLAVIEMINAMQNAKNG